MDYMKSCVDEFFISPHNQEYFMNTTNLREVGRQISAVFWSRKFWLPPHLTWEEMRSHVDVVYADPVQIWTVPILLAMVFILLRAYVTNPFIAAPLARWLGVKHRIRYPPPYKSSFEKLFVTYGKEVPSDILESSAKKSGHSILEIQEWLRQRKICHRPSKYVRFQDIVFIAIYHVVITIICGVTLYDRPWVYDITLCFKDYPHHSIENGVWWLYMIALAFYWSMTFWTLANVKTKDTNVMIVHHVCTIILMAFSWSSGFFRMGALVLLTHEPTDIPLLMGKLGRYAHLQRPTDVLFGIFVIVWIITRVTLYPFWLLRECFFHMPPETLSPAVYFQYSFGVLLLALNVLWTRLIARTVYTKLVTGDQLQDERSSDEEESDHQRDKRRKNK